MVADFREDKRDHGGAMDYIRKIMRALFVMIICALIGSCSGMTRKTVSEVSDHYRECKDIKSLKYLSNRVSLGMPRSEIESMLGNPDDTMPNGAYSVSYITHERTMLGDSFYVLTIHYDTNNLVSGYSLGVADE